MDVERAERLLARNQRRFKRLIAYTVVEVVIGVGVLISGPTGIGLLLLGLAALLLIGACYVRWFAMLLARKVDEDRVDVISSN